MRFYWVAYTSSTESIPCYAKEVYNKIELIKFVLLVKVTITFCLPEATRSHMETCFSLLQSNQSRHKFVVLGYFFLALLDDFFRGKIDFMLNILCLIWNLVEILVHHWVNNVFNSVLYFSERTKVVINDNGSCFATFV